MKKQPVYRDPSVLEFLENSLDVLKPEITITDKRIIKAMIPKICEIRARGVRYQDIYDTFVQVGKIQVNYRTFLVYVQKARSEINADNNKKPATKACKGAF